MREIWRVVLEKRMLSTKMEVDNLINVKVAITVVRGGVVTVVPNVIMDVENRVGIGL